MEGSKQSYHLMQMEYHRQALEKLMVFGEDDFDDGTILYFVKTFTPRRNPRKYKYCAMKSIGQWYTCGPRSPGPYTWDQLVGFMSDGVEQVYITVNPEFMTLDEYRKEMEE